MFILLHEKILYAICFLHSYYIFMMTLEKLYSRQSRVVHNTGSVDRHGHRHSRLLAIRQLLVTRTGTTLHDSVARPASMDIRSSAVVVLDSAYLVIIQKL